MKPFPIAPLSLALAIVYLLWPFDLIPDLLGPLGRMDDLLLFALVAWQSYVRLRPPSEAKTSKSTRAERSTRPPSPDPFTLFDLKPDASREQIEARYKELALQYHPDRVAHLGEELRTLAHEKMIEIQRAYEVLLKSSSATTTT
jgi:hypothetical protein